MGAKTVYVGGMGNPPDDDKPIPDELARHIGSLVEAASKPKPGAPTAAPVAVRPAASSQPDMDAIDRGWDEDDDEDDGDGDGDGGDDDRDDDDVVDEANADAREPRRPRKTAQQKAAARKRKAERRAEKQKARAAAALQKQKRKQPKARPPEERRPQRAATKRSAVSDAVDDGDGTEAPTTVARGWRTMAILVAVVVVLGGLVFYFSTRP